MWFEFTLNDRDGSDHKMLYNSYTSELRGDHIIPSDNKKPLEDWTIPLKVQKSNPENHLGKVKTPKTMKIQMGLACNYSCNYSIRHSKLQRQLFLNYLMWKSF